MRQDEPGHQHYDRSRHQDREDERFENCTKSLAFHFANQRITGHLTVKSKQAEQTSKNSASGRILNGRVSPANTLHLVPLQISGAEYWKRSDMAKIAKTADRKKVMDTSKSTDCPKCGKPTRIVKRVKDRERNIPGGMFISCSACEFYEKL